MKKKLFAMLLSLVMILSSVSILSEVSFAEEKTFVLKKEDGTVLGQYDEIEDGISGSTIIEKMKEDTSAKYIIEVTKDYGFTGGTRPTIEYLNITFTSKDPSHPVALTAADGNHHFVLKDGDYTFKNIILQGENGKIGGGIDTADLTSKLKITLDSGTNIRNCRNNNGKGVIAITNTVIADKKNFVLTVNKGAIIQNNIADTVGVFYVGQGNIIINGGEFINNSCKTDGGLMHSSRFSFITINNGTFKNNSADEKGGLIHSNGELTINNGVFENNSAKDRGGVIYSDCKVTINGGTFKDNYGLNGGAISSIEHATDGTTPVLNILGGQFINNKATSMFGGAVQARKTVSIKGAYFEGNSFNNNNNKNVYGGAISIEKSDGPIIENCTFVNNSAKNNSESKGFGGAIRIQESNNIILKNNTFESNSSVNGGAVLFNYLDGDAEKNIVEGNTFKNNFADSASSAICMYFSNVKFNNNTFESNGIKGDKTTEYGTLFLYYSKAKFINCLFKDNSVSDSGGAIFVFNGPNKTGYDNSFADIDNCEFIGNKAGLGGAIFTTLYSDKNPVEDPTLSYSNLKIADNVTFDKNFATEGHYNPPKNNDDFTNLKFKTTSLMGKLYILQDDDSHKKVDSVLNNADVVYINPNISIIYDSNGGTPDVKIYDGTITINDDGITEYEHKIQSLEETGLSKNGSKFKGWNTEKDGSGFNYTIGEVKELTSNLYLYAQWDDPAPAPSSTVILTLDENHRGGKITDYEVYAGELIEPHLYIPRRRGYTFRGWSYDRKHLDEVKPGDRIYTNTVLYAIWKRAEEERVEEPIEIKGDDHKAYIFGYPNGTVRANGSITRAEAAAMLSRLLKIEAIGSAAKPNFTDTESSWYNKAINAVVFRGIMKGYPDGRFRPNAPITRAEFTQMISTIDNKPYGVAPFADVPGHWAERAIGSEYQAKRITGYPDGLFRPDANITRAEAAVILNKIFERKYDNLSLLKCKNPQMIKRFTDLDESFWGWNDLVEATNSHEFIRRYKDQIMNRLEEDWLLIKDINDIK